MNINRLQLVQNAACRAILQVDSRAHIIDMENELNLPSIRDRIDFHMSIECFKQVHIPNSSSSNMFVLRETGRNTRAANTNVMIVPRVRTNMGRNAFSYKGLVHWNKLDPNKRTITDQNEFQRSVTKLNNRDVDHST